MRQDYTRDLLALTDKDLERFAEDWIARKTATYVDHKRYAGSGDMGRDVVGFRSDRRMSGPWDCFQCKQLLKPLTARAAVIELGKVFWHASQGAFHLPEKYVFVAPRGYQREVENLVDDPDRFKPFLLANWDRWCARAIAAGQRLALDEVLRALIERYDFTRIRLYDAPGLLRDEHIVPSLVTWFGHNPGKAPRGVVPAEIQPEEGHYSSQLLELYGERFGAPFADLAAALGHPDHGGHLNLQRRRFFDADAFRRFYRDSTPPSYLVDFDQDIYDGVIDSYHRPQRDRLARHDEVMAQAATVKPPNILGDHAHSSVKQGTCHHLATEGLISWK